MPMIRMKSFVSQFTLVIGILILVMTIFSSGIYGQSLKTRIAELNKLPCCDYSEVPGIIWAGNDPIMTFEELAAYCAPILWFSPDEPLLKGASGKAIRVPEPLPIEEGTDASIVYYRVRTILGRQDATGEAYTADQYDVNKSLINMENIVGIDLDYFFYYSQEEGTHAHKHDTEAAYFKLAVWNRENCPDCRYALLVTKVIGKAHGLKWYDNTLEVDKYTKFPMTVLVEEGKHASCTDKNGDGYFTPGYDVNRRINDAWGVRDVLRTGLAYSGGYQSWMTKVRQPDDRVFPPLPEDSMLREGFLVDGVYGKDNAIYILRPFPPAAFEVPELEPFLRGKGDPYWPILDTFDDFKDFSRWIEADSWVKSLSIAYRYDGDSGFSFTFPLFIVKNFEDPLAGGFIVHRMYLKDDNLRDFGWMLNYSLSASRWLDGYFSAGVEWDEIDLPEGSEKPTRRETNFVLETGFKFRATVAGTPLKFLSKLTDFWGIRFGIKNVGAFNIKNLVYVIEIGAGTW